MLAKLEMPVTGALGEVVHKHGMKESQHRNSQGTGKRSQLATIILTRPLASTTIGAEWHLEGKLMTCLMRDVIDCNGRDGRFIVTLVKTGPCCCVRAPNYIFQKQQARLSQCCSYAKLAVLYF